MSRVKDTFPRQYARTQRLTLGEPRNIAVSPDGARVVFCRSQGGSDPVNCLWVIDLNANTERLVADPRRLLDEGSDADIPPEERARRERAREGAGGVVQYATDHAGTAAVFALAGRLFHVGLSYTGSSEIRVDGPVFDPRLDPDGRSIAYVSGTTLRVAQRDGSSRLLAGEDDANVSWGSADFVAAEEMDRQRGFWWSPDGTRIAACRVDNNPVATWYLSDPANPQQPPTPHRYPAAGTANPDVTLHVLGVDGDNVEITWDRVRFPYLARVGWDSPSHLLLTVQSRDQRELAVLRAGLDGSVVEEWRDHDDAWIELTDGAGPGRLGDGRLVTLADRDGARRLIVGTQAVTPPEVQIRSILSIQKQSVLLTGNPIDEPSVVHVMLWTPRRLTQITVTAGVHSAVIGGNTLVIRSSTMGRVRPRIRVSGGPDIESFSEKALVHPNVQLFRVGERRLSCAVLLPSEYDGEAPLPVLMDPYGGPHAQRVTAAQSAYLSAQWFADQGFAVVIIDGRGTPGRGSAWEREVHHDLATPVLDDQIDGLAGLARLVPELDLERVAIRGWSFGGYLAALAVLRRPDVFRAAIAGAPVTDWRLYDTHYTERYLGDPTVDAAPYEATSLLADVGELRRPLMLIHGLADDNVVAAHTLQLSAALLAAGKPHEVLPLCGVTHMTPQETVAENLLLLQLDFLRRSLGLEVP